MCNFNWKKYENTEVNVCLGLKSRGNLSGFIIRGPDAQYRLLGRMKTITWKPMVAAVIIWAKHNYTKLWKSKDIQLTLLSVFCSQLFHFLHSFPCIAIHLLELRIVQSKRSKNQYSYMFAMDFRIFFLPLPLFHLKFSLSDYVKNG